LRILGKKKLFFQILKKKITIKSPKNRPGKISHPPHLVFFPLFN
jgi:hypothetical protein